MRNPYAQHTDFDFLQGIFRGKEAVVPCNIDMMYEINNHFLVGEWKRPNENLSIGQARALKALCQQNKFTVLIIHGYSEPNDRYIENFYQATKTKQIYLGNGEEQFIKYLQDWYKKVVDYSF